MNRKQRRMQGKAAKRPGLAPAVAPAKVAASSQAEQSKAQGMALKAAGKDSEAIPFLINSLKQDPTMADAHFTLAIMARMKPELGIDLESINQQIPDISKLKKSYLIILNIMKSKKQYKEAAICQEELCRLMPENLDEKANLALLHNLNDQRVKGLRILAELMQEAPEEKKYKGLFSSMSMSGPADLEPEEPLLRQALQTCFDNIYECNLSGLYSIWIRLIAGTPECSDLMNIEKIGKYENFQEFLETKPIESLNFINNPLFLQGLKLLIVTDIVIENALTNIRKWVCLNFETLKNENRLQNLEMILCALAEQSFFNEYIFLQTPEEQSALEKIISEIKNDDSCAYALVGCYKPLIDAFPDHGEIFSNLSGKSKAFADLMTVQFTNPKTEHDIRQNLETFGNLNNEVSKKVQQQYEEHPYPRWISVTNFPTPNDDIPFAENLRTRPYRILVAGCGTGRHAIGTAACYPESHVTAIDLSRASLAYAQRKADESGLAGRLRFVHADILEMKDWPDQFDIIESSGVLHHMEDPFLGWQTLNNLLVPGGYFKVGLYSELARQQIVEARNFVTAGQYPSTTEGIRACREDILKLPRDNIMRKKLLSFTDFYTTSLLRDLIFHVQEHRMTLPQIDGILKKLGLTCISVNMTKPLVLKQFDKMFPNDPNRANLLNWHDYEVKYPDTFAAMYQFWSRKIV